MTFIDKSDNGKKAIERATIEWLFQACILVEGQAVSLAPVDTGRLKKSIDHYVDKKEMIGYVGTNAKYAVFVEFGTGEFAENGKGRKGGWVYQSEDGKWYFTYGQAPQPYLRPAFRNTKGQVMALAKEVFRRMV